jgi:peptidylprolyl isomerase
MIALGACSALPPGGAELADLWQLQDQRAGSAAIAPFLHNGLPEVRFQAARALGAVGDPAAIPLLTACLADGVDWVRHEALFQLGQVRGAGQTEALLGQLDSKEPGMRYLAVVGLGKSRDAAALAAVQARLRDPEPVVRGAAAIATEQLTAAAKVPLAPQARDALIAGAADADADTRWRMVYALARLKVPAAADALAAAAGAAEPRTPDERWSILFALRGLAALPPDATTLAALRAGALRDDWVLQYEATSGLCRAGAELPAGFAPRSVHVRALLAAELGSHAGDPEPNVRAAALRGLARRDPAGAVAAVRQALRDPDWRLRAGAARAAQFLADGDAASVLEAALQDADPRVAIAACDALATRTRDPGTTALVERALRRHDLAVREAAAPVAEQLAAPPLTEALVAAYDDSSGFEFTEARKLLVAAAAACGGEAARGFLQRALRDPEFFVRREAARRLSALGAELEAGAAGRPERLVTPKLGEDVSWSFLRSRPVVTLSTARGEVVITLYPQMAPIHCFNLVQLVQAGAYDGRIFHRVVPNFVAQGGDHRGDGSGARAWHGGQIRDEINALRFESGTVGMPKSADNDSGGDQLFVTTVPTPHLDGRYTAFGRVTRGLAVVESIVVGDVIERAVVRFD